MEVQVILNAFVLVEAVILLVISVILFRKGTDFTKLKKYEDALIDYQAKQNDVVPMLVHELRAPLSVIKGAADLLIKNAEGMDSEQIHILLSQVKSSSNSLLKMVSDILDVSKMEGGKFQINKVFADINEIVEEECSYFQSLVKIKNIELKYEVDKHLPNLSFDPGRVKQVLNNLLSNAVKFTPKDGSIVVSTKKVEHTVRVEVKDTGVGVSRQDQAHLFHKYFQAANQDDVKEKGSGLGLVIAEGIVEAHGGKIWYEDNKPKGAKFIFALPLK